MGQVRTTLGVTFETIITIIGGNLDGERWKLRGSKRGGSKFNYIRGGIEMSYKTIKIRDYFV